MPAYHLVFWRDVLGVALERSIDAALCCSRGFN